MKAKSKVREASRPQGRMTTIAIDHEFARKLRLLAKANGRSQSDELVSLASDLLDRTLRETLDRNSAELALTGELSAVG